MDFSSIGIINTSASNCIYWYDFDLSVFFRFILGELFSLLLDEQILILSSQSDPAFQSESLEEEEE